MSPGLPSGFILCAEHDRQLGGGSLLPSLMVAKGQRSARASSRDCNFPNASLPRRGSVEQGRANGDASADRAIPLAAAKNDGLVSAEANPKTPL
jgi:hypothetical protein